MRWPHWLAHDWHLVKATRCNRYFECRDCGARKAVQEWPRLPFQPVNRHWLVGGSWDNPRALPEYKQGDDPRKSLDLRGWSWSGVGICAMSFRADRHEAEEWSQRS